MSPKAQGQNDILRDDNYFLWEFGARMALARKDLLSHIELKAQDDALRDTPEWKAADMKALGVLVKLLGPNYQTMIRDATSAGQAWGILREFFVKQNLHNRVQLRKELHDFEMPVGGNLMNHLMAFDDICLRLTAVGDALAEDERIIILLGSLPQEYDGMVKIIEAHGKVSLLETKEMSQDKRALSTSNEADAQMSVDVAAVVVAEVATEGKGVDCRQQVDHGGEDEFLFSAAETYTASWLLDSGASSHMTGDRTDFTVFEELASTLTITVANGERLPAQGKGTVKFVLEGGRTVCMTDVLYIPGINRKLISVSALASKGVQLSFGADVCVLKHEDKVVARVRKQGRLYIWDVRAEASVEGIYQQHV
ncbi:polyprotein [Phytophthora megakarya]|uniref:Polyprotein n=1 Tax=Phytophthora megakarya TaxID=4795 RepID=A0A225VF32_9STRA|nr:polyprotein [Phytophthora megakarya]